MRGHTILESMETFSFSPLAFVAGEGASALKEALP
jgi:hypothetical protein